MSNVIDFNIFGGEPLVFKGLDGVIYTIPFSISTEFVMRFMKYQQDIKKLKSNDKAFELMKQMVVDILNLDKEKNINMEYIEKYFDDVRILRIIIEEMVKHIKNISTQKNLNSPESD